MVVTDVLAIDDNNKHWTAINWEWSMEIGLIKSNPWRGVICLFERNELNVISMQYRTVSNLCDFAEIFNLFGVARVMFRFRSRRDCWYPNPQGSCTSRIKSWRFHIIAAQIRFLTIPTHFSSCRRKRCCKKRIWWYDRWTHRKNWGRRRRREKTKVRIARRIHQRKPIVCSN